jgi:hypothetical protein
MTKIVRASLGHPTLRAGPQFQNSKSVLVIEYWNLRFVCNLVLGILDFIDATIPLLQGPNYRVLGVPPVADQVSGKRNIKAEH